MGILTANLKFLYQRPALWLVYLFMGVVSMPLIGSAIRRQPFESTLFMQIFLIPILFGMIFSSLWKDTFSKAFSSCLPGSRYVPGQVIVISGVGLNLVLSFLYSLSHRPENFLCLFQTFIAVFFAGLSLFLLVAVLSFQAGNRGGIACLIFLLMPFPSVIQKIEAVLVLHPWIMAGLGTGLGIYTWFRLGQRALRRDLCVTPTFSMFDIGNQARAKRIREQLAAKKTRPGDEWRRNRLENFFMAGMKRYDMLSVGRNVWGNFYWSLGYPGLRSGPLLLAVVIFVILYAYSLPKSMQGIVFVLPAVWAGIGFPLPLSQSMLLTAGRREQFRTTMVLMPIYTVLIIAALAATGIIWQGLYILIPQVTLGRETYTCNPFGWVYLYTPLFLMPICFIIRRFFARYVFILMMIIMMVAFPLGVFLFPWLTQRNPLFIFLLIAVSWILYFLVYRDYFRRANLAGQRKA